MAQALVRELGVQAGDRVLDLGAGTGVAAGLVAAQGGHAVALDFSEAQVRAGRAAVPAVQVRVGEVAVPAAQVRPGEASVPAAQARLGQATVPVVQARAGQVTVPAVQWVVGDVEGLPFRDGVFRHAVSNLGVIYSPAPQLVLREIWRVLAPGGRLAFSAHVAHGFGMRAAALVNAHMGVPAVVPEGVRQWADPSALQALWPGEVRTRSIVVHEEHASVEAFWDFSVRERRHVRQVVRMLAPDGVEAFRREFLDLASRYTGPDGFRVAHEYLVVIVDK
ncbi:methyltransferase domain-containing protein [Actinokineospora fastidiosa]|uniref:methyltransferase domain-containing protein n=1 Tax=Actinokineospora fastidiosa TaxID=1816 RepID=UPI0016712E23|nr:methyltransferase domain-containing protein [Actinokineospora fastidiosa]